MDTNKETVKRDEVVDPNPASVQELQAAQEIFRADLEKLKTKLVQLQDAATAQEEATVLAASAKEPELATVSEAISKLEKELTNLSTEIAKAQKAVDH